MTIALIKCSLFVPFALLAACSGGGGGADGAGGDVIEDGASDGVTIFGTALLD